MATKSDLVEWVYEAVKSAGGSASVVEVSRFLWESRRAELERSGDLFYTWQYDMRWAAQKLRDSGRFKAASEATPRRWELTSGG
jgi:hypothetical protein